MTMTNRSIGTVHTSTKARLTSEARQRISMSSRFRSVNHSVSHNGDKSGKQSLYSDGDPDRHRNLSICSLAHSQTSVKISCKSVWKFLRKAEAANRQTESNDENRSSLAVNTSTMMIMTMNTTTTTITMMTVTISTSTTTTVMTTTTTMIFQY